MPTLRAPIRVALGVELPAPIVERLRGLSARVQLWTAAELERDPSGYQTAEVAVVAGWRGSELLQGARQLRWIQTIGAGVDGLLTPELVARPELVITTGSARPSWRRCREARSSSTWGAAGRWTPTRWWTHCAPGSSQALGSM